MDSKKIIPIGKKCTAILKTFIKLVFSGSPKEAADELVKLKYDGVFLAIQIDSLLFEKETLQNYFITKETSSKRDIAECLHQLLMLKEEQVLMLANLERKTVILFHFKSKLGEPPSKAMLLKEDHNSVISVMISSGMLTESHDQLAHGINTKPAKRNSTVEYYKSECSSTEESVTDIQETIMERKTQISSLEDKLDLLQREEEIYHKKVIQIKEKVSFLEQAVELWSLMHLLCNGNVDYTKLTNMVFKKATEKTRVVFKATKQLDPTFIEAWESELIRAEKGFAYVLNFTFICCRCSGTYTSMPYIAGGSLHCAACHNNRAKSPLRKLPKDHM